MDKKSYNTVLFPILCDFMRNFIYEKRILPYSFDGNERLVNTDTVCCLDRTFSAVLLTCLIARC